MYKQALRREGPNIYERKTHFGFFARGPCYATNCLKSVELKNLLTSSCLFK